MIRTYRYAGILIALAIILIGGWRFWTMRQVSAPETGKESTVCVAADGTRGETCMIDGRVVSLSDIREVLRSVVITVPDFPDTHVPLKNFTAMFENGPTRGEVKVFPELLMALARNERGADVFTILSVDTQGSGTFSYLAYFSYDPEYRTLIFVDSVELGDRIAVRALRAAKDAKAARVELLERHPDQAMSQAPTVPAVLFFAARGGRLYGYRAREDDILLDAPLLIANVASPLTVQGSARGPWFFEGSFPVTLLDWEGQVIAEGIATSTEDTMTESFVPFSAILTFPIPTDGDSGTLILKKDNPSGLPEHDAQIAVPVFFSHEYGSKG